MSFVAAVKRPPRPLATVLVWLQGLLPLLLGLWLLCLGQARAADNEDPPARAGRVAEISGEAWLFDTEAREWTRVERNQTLGEGDRLRTERRSRVALRIGSTSLWLDEDSDLEFSRLDDGRVELTLDKGSVALRLRSREEVKDYRLRTREGLFTPEYEGLYRVDQLDRGSRGLNWEGSLRFDSRADYATPVWVQAGEQVEFWWANGPRTERQSLARDEFADWLLAQRDAAGQAQAYRYVSPEMTGAEDLDRHGRWESNAEYGPLWIPTVVAVDWAPYRYGRWAWSARWGWTWVDEAPWGFAPFHYGRWVHYGGRWCWAPGRYEPRPVYAPALVAWVGGPAVSVGIIAGSRPPPPRYGWVPLAPREVYAPAYRHSPGYWQRLNRERDPVTVVRPGNNPPPQRPHRNLDVVGAVSVLPVQGGGRPMPFNPGKTGSPLQPVVQAPGRGDLPLATAPQGRPQPVFDLPRRDRPERGDRNEQRNERGDRTDRGDWQGRPNRPQPMPELQQPQRPAVPVQPAPGFPPQRPGRDTAAPVAEQQPQPHPQPQRQPERTWESRVPGNAQDRSYEAQERRQAIPMPPQRPPEQAMPQVPRPQIVEPTRPAERPIERPAMQQERPRERGRDADGPARPQVAPAPQQQQQQPGRQDDQQRGPQRGRGEWQGPPKAER